VSISRRDGKRGEIDVWVVLKAASKIHALVDKKGRPISSD
jgi:hypothetical protein